MLEKRKGNRDQRRNLKSVKKPIRKCKKAGKINPVNLELVFSSPAIITINA